MNSTTPEFMLSRQRCQQWIPLITQEFRLRHVYQIIGLNLSSESPGEFYFTLHSTTMSAPFYTSEQMNSPNPRWSELQLSHLPNNSASCVVLRIWLRSSEESDKMVLTWGVHFSGLVYVGCKIADIQAVYFKMNSVIFGMHGGFYTSLDVIRTDPQKPIPFLSSLNVINTSTNRVMYKRIAIKSSRNEIQSSYSIEKLGRLQFLQVQIRNRTSEVHTLKDKINVLSGSANSEKEISPSESNQSVPGSVRYASQLLTMNSLNKMLQDKPTKVQKQEMTRISKEIEVAKFRTRMLYHERDRKTVAIRQLKSKHVTLLEENEEKDSDLMENYHKLSRGSEKLKEYKKDIVHHREIYVQLNQQLHQRRKQLLQELLFIYPIEQQKDGKWAIQGIHLPNSDVLADSSDPSVSVALGYVTHILTMCSAFLQVPLRYPLTHFGSRSCVIDNVSALVTDRERDFPLFTRSKDKAHFTYAVYLLNKNIAQLRWLHFLHTNDLKATLSNLLAFLRRQRDAKPDSPNDAKQRVVVSLSSDAKRTFSLTISEKYVGLHTFGSISNISDPVLDCIRQENRLRRTSSPTRMRGKKSGGGRGCGSNECGKGLSEILAIPEAYLNRQISCDSLRNYMILGKSGVGHDGEGIWCGAQPSSRNGSLDNLIKITNGREIGKACDINESGECVEQGTDPLDPTTDLAGKSRPLDINHCDSRAPKTPETFAAKQKRRLSRSEGSYTDSDSGSDLKAGSAPAFNAEESVVRDGGDAMCFDVNLAGSEDDGLKGLSHSQNAPLTARTDALLATKSFNLVKQKP